MHELLSGLMPDNLIFMAEETGKRKKAGRSVVECDGADGVFAA
jgi:hypothetical protein